VETVIARVEDGMRAAGIEPPSVGAERLRPRTG
jgi:hypothetical protein